MKLRDITSFPRVQTNLEKSAKVDLTNEELSAVDLTKDVYSFLEREEIIPLYTDLETLQREVESHSQAGEGRATTRYGQAVKFNKDLKRAAKDLINTNAPNCGRILLFMKDAFQKLYLICEYLGAERSPYRADAHVVASTQRIKKDEHGDSLIKHVVETSEGIVQVCFETFLAVRSVVNLTTGSFTGEPNKPITITDALNVGFTATVGGEPREISFPWLFDMDMEQMRRAVKNLQEQQRGGALWRFLQLGAQVDEFAQQTFPGRDHLSHLTIMREEPGGRNPPKLLSRRGNGLCFGSLKNLLQGEQPHPNRHAVVFTPKSLELIVPTVGNHVAQIIEGRQQSGRQLFEEAAERENVSMRAV